MNVIVYGLGPIGMKILQHALQATNVKVIGAVDINPELVGKDAGELANGAPIGVRVVRSLSEIDATRAIAPKIALHATGSNLASVWPQFRDLMDHGYSVVSTCEQLSYPWNRYPELSQEMNDYAVRTGQFIIGTGVNPGYVMDTLTVMATTVTQKLNKIRVSRTVDVSKRRIPLQKKVGIGMQPEEFMKLAEEDRIGHVGLEESLRLIAYGLKLNLTEVTNSIQPTIANEEVILAIGPLKMNEVSGLHQIAKGSTQEGIPIELDLVMSVGVNTQDRILLETEDMGEVEFVIPNGIFGDTATVNVVVNTAKTMFSTKEAGLLTMADIRLTRNAV